MSHTISVLFYARKSRATTSGLVPIYMRVTLSGERFEVTTKFYIREEQWSAEAGKMKGNSEEAKRTNSLLDAMRVRAFDYQREIMNEGKALTMHTFKVKWLDIVTERPRMLLQIFEHHNKQMKELIGQEFSPLTFERYTTSKKHTRDFMKWKYNVDDMNIKDMNYEFITDYEFWLKSVRKCDHNTTMKYLSNFKKIVNICLKNIGFVLNENEGRRLIASDERNSEVVRLYLSGDDINSNFDQRASRYIIDFKDLTIEKASSYVECFNVVVEKVKPQRDEVYANGKQIHELSFWKFWDKRPELYQRLRSVEFALVCAAVTKYVKFSKVNKDQVFMHKLIVLPYDEPFILSIINSCFHEEWCWKYSSTLGGGTLNYSVRDVFETFPLPIGISDETHRTLGTIGELCNNVRNQIMTLTQLGLTKIYNLVHSQYLTSIDIVAQSKQPREVCEKAHLDILKLRELHVQMDQAVLEAYGWQDIQLRHNFYEVDYLPENDRVRYTIHPEARKEILKRLLELNHKIHEEEVKAGLWDKKKAGKEKKKNVAEEPKEGYGGLFE